MSSISRLPVLKSIVYSPIWFPHPSTIAYNVSYPAVGKSTIDCAPHSVLSSFAAITLPHLSWIDRKVSNKDPHRDTFKELLIEVANL